MGAVNWRAAVMSLAAVACVACALPATAAVAVGLQLPLAVQVRIAAARAGASALGPGGTWGPGEQLAGVAAGRAAYPGVTSVSCPSAGDCGALGRYLDSSGMYQLFVASETGGIWGASEEIPGLLRYRTDIVRLAW
jgi:hypothetical protein